MRLCNVNLQHKQLQQFCMRASGCPLAGNP